jgi:hypothetical protein
VIDDSSSKHDLRKFDNTLQYIQKEICCFLDDTNIFVNLDDLKNNVNLGKLKSNVRIYANSDSCAYNNTTGFFYLFYSLSLNLYASYSAYRNFAKYERKDQTRDRQEVQWFLGINRLFTEFHSRIVSTLDNLAQLHYVLDFKLEEKHNGYQKSKEAFRNSNWRDSFCYLRLDDQNRYSDRDLKAIEVLHKIRNTLTHRSYIYVVPLKKEGSTISDFAMLKASLAVCELDEVRGSALDKIEQNGISHWGQLEPYNFVCQEDKGVETPMLVKDYMQEVLLLVCRMIAHTNELFAAQNRKETVT